MTSVSTYGQAQSQLNYLTKLLQQTDTLQEQAATGQTSNTYAGLGNSALPDLQANASLASLTNYDDNITNGQTQISLMSNAVSEVQTEATTLSTAMQAINQDGSPDMSSLSGLAQNSLSFIQNLLNEKNGSNYVFSGADTSTAPLGSTDAMTSYINTQISDWTSGKITTDQLVSSFTDPTQLTDTTAGYSATLSSGKAGTVAVQASDDSSVDYTTLANDPSFRDVLVGAAMLVGLTQNVGSVASTYTTDANGNSVQQTTPGVTTAPGTTAAAQSSNYFSVFNSVIDLLNKGSTGLASVGSNLGYAASSLKTTQANNSTDETTLQNQIGSIQTVDLNTVATELTSLQTQLQASYEVTASMQQYSLVNYLTS